MRLKAAFLVFVTLALTVVGSAATANPQLPPAEPTIAAPAAASLSATPAILDQGIVPGTRVQSSVRITNAGSQPIALNVIAQSFEADMEVEERFRNVYDASMWFTFATPELTLGAGEGKDVVVYINAPLDATPGGHYATIVFAPASEAASIQEGAFQVAGRVGVLALLTVAGQVRESMSLDGSFRARETLFTQRPVFEFTVTNGGNVHSLVSGRVRLSGFGRDDREFEVSPELVLPHSKRSIQIDLPEDVPIGAYRSVFEVTYGTPTKSLSEETHRFYVIELWVFWVAGILLVVLMAGLVLAVHRRRRQTNNGRHFSAK